MNNNMDNNKEALFIGYIDGTLDQEQLRELERLMTGDPQAKHELLEMKEIADCMMQEEMTPYEKDRRAAALMNLVTGGRSIAGIRMREILRYAAVAAAAAAFTVFALILFKPAAPPVQTAIDIRPGGSGAIVLPDGSKVTLKSASSLYYDAASFDGKKDRIVRLDGEAFFNVARAEGREFIVQTDREIIHVTGTSFNMQAFSEDESNTLTLLDGKVSLELLGNSGVRLHRVELHPGERCVFEKGTGEVAVEKISRGEAAQDWNSGAYYFRGESLHNIVSHLERYYNASIETGPGLEKEGGYTGAFSLGDGLDRILSLLNYDNAFVVEKREDGSYLLRAK